MAKYGEADVGAVEIPPVLLAVCEMSVRRTTCVNARGCAVALGLTSVIFPGSGGAFCTRSGAGLECRCRDPLAARRVGRGKSALRILVHGCDYILDLSGFAMMQSSDGAHTEVAALGS